MKPKTTESRQRLKANPTLTIKERNTIRRTLLKITNTQRLLRKDWLDLDVKKTNLKNKLVNGINYGVQR